jgi:hypothetical protein
VLARRVSDRSIASAVEPVYSGRGACTAWRTEKEGPAAMDWIARRIVGDWRFERPDTLRMLAVGLA